MADLSDFQQYYKLADFLIEESSKEQLAECARRACLEPCVLSSEIRGDFSGRISLGSRRNRTQRRTSGTAQGRHGNDRRGAGDCHEWIG
jgi:hypothetical protein